MSVSVPAPAKSGFGENMLGFLMGLSTAKQQKEQTALEKKKVAQAEQALGLRERELTSDIAYREEQVALGKTKSKQDERALELREQEIETTGNYYKTFADRLAFEKEKFDVGEALRDAELRARKLGNKEAATKLKALRSMPEDMLQEMLSNHSTIQSLQTQVNTLLSIGKLQEQQYNIRVGQFRAQALDLEQDRSIFNDVISSLGVDIPASLSPQIADIASSLGTRDFQGKLSGFTGSILNATLSESDRKLVEQHASKSLDPAKRFTADSAAGIIWGNRAMTRYSGWQANPTSDTDIRAFSAPHKPKGALFGKTMTQMRMTEADARERDLLEYYNRGEPIYQSILKTRRGTGAKMDTFIRDLKADLPEEASVTIDALVRAGVTDPMKILESPSIQQYLRPSEKKEAK